MFDNARMLDLIERTLDAAPTCPAVRRPDRRSRERRRPPVAGVLAHAGRGRRTA